MYQVFYQCAIPWSITIFNGIGLDVSLLIVSPILGKILDYNREVTD
jgi:hypothetical protein